jgi:RND superfamily putative drug exporter
MTDTATPTRIATEEPARPARGLGFYTVGALAILLFFLALAGGAFQGKLSKVQKNDSASYLPGSAESTKVSNEIGAFTPVQVIPGFVVYHRPAGLTAADRAKITADVSAYKDISGVAADQVGAPIFKADVASIYVPLIGKVNGKEVASDSLSNAEKKVIKQAKHGLPDGLKSYGTGAGGLIDAFVSVFKGIDGVLLFAAIGVVIGILLIVYRSPILWAFPLVSAFFALNVAALVLYPLAKHNVLTLTGQSQGILSVLVIGAGTDYALLLISRYREELHNWESPVDAMIWAWKGAAPAIGASALTVILGLSCLTLGELNSDKSLGPVCAIGIACTVSMMLTFLPAFLLFSRVWTWSNPVGWILILSNRAKWRLRPGRAIFWPRVPHTDHATDIATHGGWAKFAQRLGRGARRYWILTAVVLAVFAIGIIGLKSDGLNNTQSFTTKPDAITGQHLYDDNFNVGEGAPAQIITNAAQGPQVVDLVKQVDGVADVHQMDVVKDGRVLILADLKDRYDTSAATQAVRDIRSAVGSISGAHAIVGGQTAINLDAKDASRHDRNLIIPIILAVILVVLALLLRALLAPLLLIATVVLSFTATLGVSAFVFNHVFHFANSDPGFPLFAFVFLVALGIDYNIFLLTRVREETLKFGTRDGVLRGLAVTGGVITSAGVVLAATFVVLGVLPLVFFAELGFTVAFGVLLDTIIVRSVLVPALTHDLGRVVWWPSKLAHAAE